MSMPTPPETPRAAALGASVSPRSIEDRVRTVLVEHLGVDPAEVTPDAQLALHLGADSLDLIELTLGLEVEFVIEIPDADARGITTVADIVRYVSARVEGEARS